ncbi:MAG: Hsp33 family molecular chaperone HslO [Candidatus Spyradocola sp.]|jgi:molecular chaperone Hsp33
MDQILHISLEGGQARALVACTTDLVEAARRTHDLSPTACAALGRTLTASAMLGAMLKGADDSLTVTIRGGGPIGALVCVARPDGVVKGYCDNPQVDLPPRPDGKLDVGGAVGRDGRVTVVKDLGLRDPYVGQTRLVSGEIAEDIAFYLTASEQTPSLLSLGVMVEGGHVVGAGGVLVQPFPDCPEATLQRLEALAPHLASVSGMARRAGSAQALAEEALAGFAQEVLEARTPRFACDCSRERIERALLSMGEAELRDMIDEQHGAQVSCHFCNRVYDFTEEELRALLAEGKGADGQGAKA